MRTLFRTLFISDLHLCEDRPDIVRAFETFMLGPARDAQALYVLGDLFEYWAGDDDDAPLGTVVADAFSALAAGGTRIYFVAGNRDFLVGPGYAARASFEILPDPSLITLDGQRFVISHGDALCTDDIVYQTYREQFRTPAWQQAFVARPLADRKQLIAAMRQQSMAAKQEKDATIMDVNAQAVAVLLREYGYPTLIHGHTHRPARHVHEVDGHLCERWVLADWDRQAAYLEWDGHTLTSHPITI